MSKKDITQLVGKNVIWSVQGMTQLTESTVKEISPNNEYVNLGGEWRKIKSISVHDVILRGTFGHILNKE